MWVYWQGVRVHIEHHVHARELDFLVKDDLVGREVTMVCSSKPSAPFKWPTLLGHFATFDEPKGSFDWCYETMSAALALILASSIHIGYDEPLQDETIVRIKVFLWKTFLFLSGGWFEVDSCLLCIQVFKGCPTLAPCFKSNYIPL